MLLHRFINIPHSFIWMQPNNENASLMPINGIWIWCNGEYALRKETNNKAQIDGMCVAYSIYLLDLCDSKKKNTPRTAQQGRA